MSVRRFDRKNAKSRYFYFARCVRILHYYGDFIHSFDWKSAVEHDGDVKMRDSALSVRYSSVCNVLCVYRESRSSLLIVYLLYDDITVTSGE